MAPQIPDRWLNYKPIGERIEGTRFVAFKVPLREQISNSVDEENRLDGNILLKQISSLGLIIDLTNTSRYYDPKFFELKGVEHKKLMIPGRATPSNNLVHKFILYVKNFLTSNANNDKLIGVHCTHGVNRTGYMICNYMISELTIQPEDAIKRFNVARGHKIERENYLESLQNPTKYNSQESSPNKVQTTAADTAATSSNRSWHADRETRNRLPYGRQGIDPRHRERGFGPVRGPERQATATIHKSWSAPTDNGFVPVRGPERQAAATSHKTWSAPTGFGPVRGPERQATAMSHKPWSATRDNGFGAVRGQATATSHNTWSATRDNGNQYQFNQYSRDQQQRNGGGGVGPDRHHPYQRYNNQQFVRHNRSDTSYHSHNGSTYDRQHSFDRNNGRDNGRGMNQIHPPQQTNRHRRFED